RDSDFIGGTNLSTWADFQEFYVQYVAPIGSSLNVQLGQFNSVVGYEVVESPRNANYSRSWLFGLGQPFTTRGARISYEFTKQVSLSVGAISYINSSRADTDYNPLVEYALGVAPSETMKFTWYGLAGPRSGQSGTPGGTLFLTGGYLSMQITEQTSAVIESYYANQANSSTISPGKNARWEGVAAYLIHDFTKEWGVRLRGEIFEDAGGFVACQGTTDYQPRANVCFGASTTAPAPAIAQTLWEFTSTLQYKPIKSLTTRLEYRYDKSNQNVFQVGGRPTSYQPTLSVEAIYSF
ncbi:MAG TPA: outer membrane beta-barrel protein, partial [Nitrospiraceae bacterium]